MGISFENWNGDNKKYFHPFTGPTELKSVHEILNQNKPLIEHSLPQYAYNGTSVFASNKKTGKWESFLNHSYHFDAHLVGKFLRKHAVKRGVNRIEGKVKGFDTDIDNNIKESDIVSHISCWFHDGKNCGKCKQCFKRELVFRIIGIRDEYKTDPLAGEYTKFLIDGYVSVNLNGTANSDEKNVYDMLKKLDLI
jgi:hypothetical protein